MVGHALAAEALPLTVVVGAGALFQVLLLAAFHNNHLRISMSKVADCNKQVRRKRPASCFDLAVKN
jgi:hypothetical protein